jgi:hypothetical protein
VGRDDRSQPSSGRGAITDKQQRATRLVGAGQVKEVFVLAVILVFHGRLVRGNNQG